MQNVTNRFLTRPGEARTCIELLLLATLSLELAFLTLNSVTAPVLHITLAAILGNAAALAILVGTRSDPSTPRLKVLGKAVEDHFLLTACDRSGRFQWANESFLARTGYSLDELKSKPIGGICSGQYSDVYLSRMWSTVQDGGTWTGEFCDVAKNGSLLWLKALVVPVRNGLGEVESLITLGVDISEQRMAEIELKRTNARLQAFVKHAPAAVAMFDTNLRYIDHTDRWLSDYRLEGTSLNGRHHYDVFPEIPPHWRAKHQRILAGATETCEEERFTRKDGTDQILRWEVRPWYLPDDTIGGMMMLTEEITERKKLQDNLWRLAKLDTLTSLPNRLHFGELLQEAMGRATELGKEVGVALIDIDRFKEINDTLGHDAGDALLKTLAGRFSEVLTKYGIVARLGGDEFAVLITNCETVDTICDAINAIQTALSEPITLNGVSRPCTVSIGVTRFPHDAQLQSDLLKNADLALYRAKDLGRDRAEVFTSDLRASLDRCVELQTTALAAIANDEFLLHYQPVVPTNQDEPISFEALLRWMHPEQGLIAPGRFEEVLEDNKLAYAIGERVIDLTLAQIRIWETAKLSFGRIAVNVTTADLHDGTLALRLRRKLAEHNVAPQRLCIEVTERVFLGSDVTALTKSLREVKELGVEIALDDFGTGYASLTHLKSFPIDRLKIDRSFIHDMLDSKNSLSIVQAMTQLGTSLGLRITAEGVETFDQLTLLKSMGCSSIQGYVYAKPMPGERVGAFLADHHGPRPLRAAYA